MMKNYYYLSVAFLAAMFFVSCSDSYDNKFLYVEKNNLPVWQIAETLNFPNPSFFSKFFKREAGMTPNEFRLG